MTSYNKVNGEWSYYNYDLVTSILRGEWGCDGWIITDNVATDLITVADGLRGGMTAYDASLTLLLNFEPYENDPYIRTLMREACHRGLYALANSAAMNGIGPNTEISKIIFWPVKLSFALAIIFWGLSAFCAVRWHRRRKAWKIKKQSAETND